MWQGCVAGSSRRYSCFRRPALVAIVVIAGCSSGNDSKSDVPRPGSLEQGTKVGATIQTAVTSRTNRQGDSLYAIVSREVKDASGGIVVPAGSRVAITVAALEPGTLPALPDGRFSLSVRAITIGERTYAVSADLAEVPHHLEWRTAVPGANESPAGGGHPVYRDVIVTPGTPIVFTLAQSLKVSAR